MGRQPAADLDMLREERGWDIAGRVAAPAPPPPEEAAPGLGQVLAGGEDRHRGVVRPRALAAELETNPREVLSCIIKEKALLEPAPGLKRLLQL